MAFAMAFASRISPTANSLAIMQCLTKCIRINSTIKKCHNIPLQLLGHYLAEFFGNIAVYK